MVVAHDVLYDSGVYTRKSRASCKVGLLLEKLDLPSAQLQVTVALSWGGYEAPM